ncbi:baseplate J/gp47 family protein [Aeromonas sp. WP2-W18-CRE-05]|uniref:baseplate J/gp47 family protein n=1 Tax=Aeromonas sp. WP2-W18-CRE-05 TaxID=2675707 RepID=UPI0015DCF91C|nr:baseplate J/gp47 family protein [Aeromonas sp. WP2-W18-CRE-05]BBQ24643.1 phage baseplate protein [Aeromonas sp. WP2-W18-CRE-05]
MSSYSLRPTLREIIQRVRADVTAELDDPLRRSDAEVYARAYAGAVHGVNGHIEYLERNLLPDLCDEQWLLRHAGMKKCPRKEAQPAAGWLRISGVSDGITVSAGAVAVYQGSTPIQYVATEAATSSGGVLRLPITCSETGYHTNLDDGEGMILSEPVAGLSSSGVADSVQGGTDLESVDDWRARVIDRWFFTPQGGADTDYQVWAEEVPGVTRAWCYRHWMGTGTVGVFLVDDNSEALVPSAAIVAAARQHIEPKAPVAAAELYLLGINIKRVAHRIKVTPDTPEVRAAVTAAMREFYRREGGPEQTIAPSRLSEAISAANGEYKHQLLAPAAEFTTAKGEIVALGTTTWD